MEELGEGRGGMEELGVGSGGGGMEEEREGRYVIILQDYLRGRS